MSDEDEPERKRVLWGFMMDWFTLAITVVIIDVYSGDAVVPIGSKSYVDVVPTSVKHKACPCRKMNRSSRKGWVSG